MLKDNRTFVPLRFISELLDCTVDWEEDTKTVVITSPKEVVRFPEPIVSVNYPESVYDKMLFNITVDNYREFERDCPNYEFKVDFINPSQLNVFEQNEGAIAGWQSCRRNNFVMLTNSQHAVTTVKRKYYTTREFAKTYVPKEGDTIKFKLTIH